MIEAMKYDWVEIHDLARFVKDPAWSMSQKADGVHCMIELAHGEVGIYGQTGEKLAHAASAVHFDALRRAFGPLAREGLEGIFDGELLPGTGTLWLFDVPELGHLAGHDTPFGDRRNVLEAVWRMFSGTPGWGTTVRMLPEARTTEEKAALAAAVEANGGEGVMVKRLDAPYEPGRRVKHGLKIKYVKTADVIVSARDIVGSAGKVSKNAELECVDENGQRVTVGRCSMIGKADAQIGDVIEVAFLYATADLVLYQPRMMKMRPDKAPGDCGIGQLRSAVVNREVVGA